MILRSPCLRTVLLTGVVALLVAVRLPHASADGHSDQSLALGVARELHSPAVAVLTIENGSIARSSTWGEHPDGRPVNADSVFVWGSVSKSIAAATIGQLEQRGELDRTTPVVEILPNVAGSALDDSGTTIEDVINHTSGLAHDMSWTDDWDRRVPATTIAADVARHAVAGPRGSYRYSSLNYILVQAVVETVTAGSYADAVDDLIGVPAGTGSLINTVTEFDTAVPAGTVPYFLANKQIPTGVDASGFGYGYTAGTAEQLARYTQWQMSEHRHADTPRNTHPPGCITSGPNTCYVNGLRYQQRNIDGKHATLVRHSGAVPGFYTHIAFDPERDRGVVILSASYGEVMADHTAAVVDAHIDTLVYGQHPTEPPRNLHPLIVGIGVAVVAILASALLWLIYAQFTGRSTSATQRRARLQLSVWALAGVAVIALQFYGIPALLGAPHQIIYRWAPDVALLLWIGTAELLALAAVGVWRAGTALASSRK